MPAPKGTRLILRGGIWYIVWTGNTRGRSTRTGNRKDAETALADFIRERERTADAGAALTVIDALEHYFAEHVNVNVVDRDRQEQIRPHLEAHFGHLPIKDIAPSDSRAYARARREGTVGWTDDLGRTRGQRRAGDGTIRRELGLLVAAINHAVSEKRLERAHVPPIELPDQPPPRELWLEEGECEALLRASKVQTVKDDSGRYVSVPVTEPTRVYMFALIALETGARRTSIEELSRFQISRTGVIDFNKPGRKRTKKRRAVVPMSDRLATEMKVWLASHKSEFVLEHSGAIRTAFESAVERAALAYEAVGDQDRAAKMRKVTPHTLRHTYATLALQHGVPIWDVAGVLGDTVETVRRTYGHHCPDRLRSAVNFRRSVPAKTEERG